MSKKLTRFTRASCAISLALCVAATLPATAQELPFIEYEVKPGDTCIKIARKVYEDGGLCYELMAGSNEFDEKFRIYPGQKLKLPTKQQLELQRQEKLQESFVQDPALPAQSSTPDAELKAFRGDVTARSPEASDWEKASRNQELWRRWKVNSADSSSASVFFVREKATLRMRENTLVVIYGKGEIEGTPGTARHAVLEKGALATRLGELSGGSASSAGTSVEVETPSAVVNTTGGDALVSVVQGDTTLVANHTSPSTNVRGTRKSSKPVKLPEDMGLRVKKGEEPSVPQPLPAPPVWDKPAFSAVSMGGKSSVRASWQAVKDVVVWRVEVWRAQGERELIDVSVLDAKIRELALEDFTPGDYELRIATINTDGFESKMSEPVSLTVKELLANMDALPADVRTRQASGALYLGEQLAVAEGLDCTFGGRRLYNGSVSVNNTGTQRLVCMDRQGVSLPAQSFIVSPNTATLTRAPSAQLPVDAVEEIRFSIAHPIERIDLFFSDGFKLAGTARREEDGSWVVPVKATQPDRQGELRVGTPGILGATLLQVPLASGSMQESVASRQARSEEKPWHVQLGAYADSRDVTGTGLSLEGERFDQNLRVGVNSGVQWRRHLVLDLQADAGAITPRDNAAERAQTFGLATALSYRFGPWAIKPYLRVGAGVDFIPDLDERLGRVFGGGGLAWTLERRVELRLDVHELLIFDDSESPGALAPGATFGFGATF